MALIDDSDRGAGKDPAYAGDGGVEVRNCGWGHGAEGGFHMEELGRCPGADPDVVRVP